MVGVRKLSFVFCPARGDRGVARALTTTGEQLLFTERVDVLLTRNPDAQLTSLLRTPAENVAARGAPSSLHLEGLAGDFDIPLADRSRLVEFGREAESIGLSAIVYDTPTKNYVHVQARPLIGGGRFSEVFG